MASLLSKIGVVQRTPTFVGDAVWVQSACAGKVGFATPQLAASVANRGDKPRHHYRCQWCGLYHLGSRQ